MYTIILGYAEDSEFTARNSADRVIGLEIGFKVRVRIKVKIRHRAELGCNFRRLKFHGKPKNGKMKFRVFERSDVVVM